MSVRYLSVCSGIEAATVAWHPLGFEPAAFAEIERFPSAVLAHHYPDTPNLGDMTRHAQWKLGHQPDLLVGGTPCQSFSVAGLRAGLADPRGNLALVYLAIAAQFRPRWLLWENVPGILSSNDGQDFGAFVGALGELGYGFAYRVLDAQFFGIPQRRRRVFVVGYLGDWRRASAVLFEPESLRRHPISGRTARQEVAGTLVGGAKRSGYTAGPDEAAGGLLIAFNARQDPIAYEKALPLDRDGSTVAIAFKAGAGARAGSIAAGVTAPTLCSADGNQGAPSIAYAADGYNVRKLTPRECERLQGFPDDYTAIKGAKDGPRYCALGNSMAVPVMRWIGERIALVDAQTTITDTEAAA